ncbi:MAG: STAS domain-containing protein [Legionella sp.]|nr:STAS domain-containing protein [Legionella sp.]
MLTPSVFVPAKNLTFETVSAELKRFLVLLNKHKKTSVLFDLSQVLQCDSAGLALLIEAKRLCKLRQQDFLIQNMSNTMTDLATFCGINNLFLGELVND